MLGNLKRLPGYTMLIKVLFMQVRKMVKGHTNSCQSTNAKCFHVSHELTNGGVR